MIFPDIIHLFWNKANQDKLPAVLSPDLSPCIPGISGGNGSRSGKAPRSEGISALPVPFGAYLGLLE